MEDVVRNKLTQLTADFYVHNAASFHASRRRPWQSWDRIMVEIAAPRSVLDVGCGNGRWATYLDERGGLNNYLGTDSSAALINIAQTNHPLLRFAVESIDSTLARDQTFELVVAFGIFHHLPGAHYRRAVLHELLRLSKGGTLVVSLWQPSLLPNFIEKTIDDAPIGELEPNDYLMGWNGDTTHVRYCHNFTDREIDELIEDAGVRVVANFQGTNNDVTNRYLILESN